MRIVKGSATSRRLDPLSVYAKERNCRGEAALSAGSDRRLISRHSLSSAAGDNSRTRPRLDRAFPHRYNPLVHRRFFLDGRFDAIRMKRGREKPEVDDSW